MAILIIEQQGRRQAGALKGRVLIGRWPDNTVVIDDRAVSRIHAWIGLQDGQYYIADAGSRTGTFVNGDALRERHLLHDGDQIRIGPTVLRYRTDPAPPPDDQPIDLSPRPPADLSGAPGMFMDCVCGAPLWLPREFAGIGQCRFCGHTVTQAPAAAAKLASGTRFSPAPTRVVKDSAPITPPVSEDSDDFETVMDDAFTPASTRPIRETPSVVSAATLTARGASAPRALGMMPKPPGIMPRSAAPAVPFFPPASQSRKASGPRAAEAPAVAKVEKSQKCGICHAPITVFDDVSSCPSCSLVFHAECWQENRGCSAYGCAQVGALSGENKS